MASFDATGHSSIDIEDPSKCGRHSKEGEARANRRKEVIQTWSRLKLLELG